MSRSNGESQIKSIFSRSPELREKFYELMWGKDGKSGIAKEPYADKIRDLIPEGVKLLDLIKHEKKNKLDKQE